MNMVAAVVTLTVTGFTAYALRGKFARRCSACGRRFVVDSPHRWCINGHELHYICVKDANERRKVCPICGIYVSDQTAP
jgi:hypothetical protein